MNAEIGKSDMGKGRSKEEKLGGGEGGGGEEGIGDHKNAERGKLKGRQRWRGDLVK